MELNVKQAAMDLQDQVTAWRRELHQCPELKLETIETEKIILRALKEIGIEEVRSGIGGHGVAAIIRGSQPGKCLGIRADCDGLPMTEETGLPFASKNGNMHACGHDAHTAMALGVAKLLHENRDKLKGVVKMVFQPGEEGGGGAEAMIEDGVLQNPTVDAMISHHSGTSRFEEVGPAQVGWTYDPSSFYITGFRAVFHGKSAHVAEPHLAIDPVIMGCYAVTQMQAILSREKMPCKPGICAVTVFKAGEKNNIIPDSCYIEGSIRSNNKDDQAYYIRRTREIFESVASSMQGSVDFDLPHILDATENDPEMVRKFVKTAGKALGEENVIEVKIPIPGGEDFCEFSKAVPSVYYYHGGNFGDDRDFPQHNPKFDINENTLWSGVAALSQFALDWQDA